MEENKQKCKRCKKLCDKDLFEGFKTCINCRERARENASVYRDKYREEINRKKREKYSPNGTIYCEACGVRIRPEIYDEHVLKPNHYLAVEMIIKSRERAIKLLSEDEEFLQKLPEDIRNDKDKLRERILRGLPDRYRMY